MANNFARTVTGLITSVEYYGTSLSGNPAWEVEIMDMDGDFSKHITSSDVSLAYGLDSRKDLRTTPTTYGLTRAGRLNGYTRPA